MKVKTKYTKHQTARTARADFEDYEKIGLIKKVSLLMATYQVRLLLYRCIEEKKKLVIFLPSGAKLGDDFMSLTLDYKKNIKIERI